VARPKKKPIFLPAGGQQAIRGKFLRFAFYHGSPALHLLATDVQQERTTVANWAKSLGQAGTWLEQWAQDALVSWKNHTYPPPKQDDEGILNVYFPWPDEQGEEDVFHCTLEGKPLSRLAHRVTIAGAPWWDEGMPDDRETFRKQMHDKLDRELNEFFKEALRLGRSKELRLPADLDLKLEASALYLLCGKSRVELAAAVHAAEATVYGWLTETLELLQLQMKTPGHQPKVASSLD